jgi:hypothetical protein
MPPSCTLVGPEVSHGVPDLLPDNWSTQNVSRLG